MKLRSLCLSLILVGLTGTARAEDFADLTSAPLAGKPAKVLWVFPEARLTLPLQDVPSEREIEIPAFQPSRKTVALRFRARFDWPQVGGVSRALGIKIDDTPLEPSYNPIINRTEFEFDGMHKSGVSGWWGRFSNTRWGIIIEYSPEAGQLEPRILTDREEGHWYLVNVQNIMRSSAPHTLTIENLAVNSLWPNGPKPSEGLVIEGLSLVEVD